MITTIEIVDLQLRLAFETSISRRIKSLVNRELDAGIYMEGYEIAVSKNDLEIEEATELLAVLLRAAPELELDLPHLKQLVDKELPQTCFAKPSWMIDHDGTFVMTDSLRVAKFQSSQIAWCTPRISYDGIEFLEIAKERVSGLAWHLSEAYKPDELFSLDYTTGEVLRGSIVEFD